MKDKSRKLINFGNLNLETIFVVIISLFMK